MTTNTNTNKRAGWNRRARGNFFSKLINVQAKIRPITEDLIDMQGEFFLKINKCADKNKAVQGGFFLKINKRACTSIRHTRVLKWWHDGDVHCSCRSCKKSTMAALDMLGNGTESISVLCDLTSLKSAQFACRFWHQKFVENACIYQIS